MIILRTLRSEFEKGLIIGTTTIYIPVRKGDSLKGRVIQAIPTFTTRFIKLSRNLCNEISTMMARFW